MRRKFQKIAHYCLFLSKILVVSPRSAWFKTSKLFLWYSTAGCSVALTFQSNFVLVRLSRWIGTHKVYWFLLGTNGTTAWALLLEAAWFSRVHRRACTLSFAHCDVHLLCRAAAIMLDFFIVILHWSALGFRQTFWKRTFNKIIICHYFTNRVWNWIVTPALQVLKVTETGSSFQCLIISFKKFNFIVLILFL